jgi:DUF917 family protein
MFLSCMLQQFLVRCAATTGGHPLQTEDLRYGLRVSILGLPAHPLLRTPEALAVVGPAAFGYDDVKYQPLAEDSQAVPVL